jgi:hypothetical protein
MQRACHSGNAQRTPSRDTSERSALLCRYIIRDNTDATSIGELEYTLHVHQPIVEQVQLPYGMACSASRHSPKSELPSRAEQSS